MEYLDLFELMGIQPEEKKEVKKKETNKGKKVSSKKAEVMIKLPATVYTGYSQPYTLENIAGKTEVTLDEAHKYLSDVFKDYPVGISSLQKGKDNVLYLVHKKVYMLEKTSIHVNKDTKLMLGGEEYDITAIMDTEDCDIELSKLREHFASIFPDYGEVGFIHSAINNVIVPSFNFSKLEEKLTLPVTIKVFGRQDVIITEEDYLAFVNKSKASEGEDSENSNKQKIKAEKEILMDIVIEQYPDFAEGHLELQWNNNKKVVIAKMIERGQTTISSNTKIEEETFPTNATLSLIYTRMQLSPVMFGGKERVTKEELRKFIEKDRPEYSKERTMIKYDKKLNLIIMFCNGSRKGVDLISDDITMLNYMVKDEPLLIDFYKDGSLYRVEKNEIFLMMAPKQNYNRGSFRMLIPPIPIVKLKELIMLFKYVYENHNTEIMLQLFWNKDSQEYFWYIPKQMVTSVSCNIKRNIELEMEHYLIGDFHSHGAYPAAFSIVDDKDELGFRIYGVIGDLDKKRFSISLRAGTGGCFIPLNIRDIFDCKDNILDNLESYNIDSLKEDISKNVIFV